MLKKLTLLAMAIGALVAFAAPAAANASALVTDEKGEAAETVTAFSSNTKSETAGGTLFCNEVSLHINLTVNNTEEATGSGSGSAKHNGGACLLGTNAIIDITEVKVNHIKLLPNGTGTALFTYVYDVTSGGNVVAVCHFESAKAATITKVSGTRLHVAGELKGKTVAGLPVCAAAGNITGEFDLQEEASIDW